MRRSLLIGGLVILLTLAWLSAKWIAAGDDKSELITLREELRVAKGENARLQRELQDKANSAAHWTRAPEEGSSAASTPLIGLEKAAAPSAQPVAAPGGVQGLVKMMNTPEMKGMMKQQQAMQIEMQYGGLVRAFNFAPAETEHFKKLLGDRLTKQSELGMKLLDPNLRPEQRTAIGNEVAQAKADSDREMRTFLNDEGDFSALQRWEDTQSERTILQMAGRTQFEATGEPLSGPQEEQLINTMAEIRKQPALYADLSKSQDFDPLHLTEDQIQLQLQQQDTRDRLVQERAQAFLSPVQIDALAKMQKQWRGMTDAGLRMSRGFLQGTAGK